MGEFSNLHKIRVQVVNFGLHKLIFELGKLLARCPGLTDLDIYIEDVYYEDFFGESALDTMSKLFRFLDKTGKPLSLRNLRMNGLSVSPRCMELGIRNLRSLQSLHIYKFSSTTSSGLEHTIWDVLRKERIYIQSLSTDAADDSLLRYLSSFNGMRKFSLIKYSFPQFDPISLLQIMIPHHAESLTELSVLEGSECQFRLIWSENLVNLLSSFKNLQYFGVQCYSSIIVGVFCNVNIFVSSLTRSQESTIQNCTKIFPKLQRLVLHTPMMAISPQNAILSPSTIFHDAITQYQLNSSPVASFEIECEGRVYIPRHDETTGTFSYHLRIC